MKNKNIKKSYLPRLFDKTIPSPFLNSTSTSYFKTKHTKEYLNYSFLAPMFVTSQFCGAMLSAKQKYDST
eukprot:snap_masked-scaffold_22-processed-gene-0.45-mRNA-1 protein AED:1.00 eAED:1.00 QI:0/-1/0/0/-1/1/1/0/69